MCCGGRARISSGEGSNGDGYLALDAAKVEIDDEETFGDLCEALDERLEEDEAYWILTDRPLRQIVEQLCRDLELSPDWSRWCDEDQCWAPGYVPVRPRWSAFNTPSRKRILPEDDGEPPPEAEARSASLRPAAGGTPAVQAHRQLE